METKIGNYVHHNKRESTQQMEKEASFTLFLNWMKIETTESTSSRADEI